MPRPLFLACVAVWALAVAACCFPGDDTKKPTSTIEQVGDGPPVEVPLPAQHEPPPTPGPATPAKPADPKADPKGEPAPFTPAPEPAAKATPWEQELAQLEADAAEAVPEVKPARGQAPEVADLARAMTALRRAEHIADRMKPARENQLDATDLRVGQSGRLDVAVRIVRVDEGVVVVSVPKGRIDRALFAVSGIETSTLATDQLRRLNGRYEVYRTAKFGLYTLVVLRSYQPDGTRQWKFDRAVELAEKRRGDLAAPQAALAAAKDKAMKAALAAAAKELDEKYPVPEAGPIQERIKAKRDRDAAEVRLAKAARQQIEERYAEPR